MLYIVKCIIISLKLTIMLTCISFQVFRGYHDHKTDGPFIAKHFVGPATDRTHTFDCSDPVVGYQHLKQEQKSLVLPEERQELERYCNVIKQ